MQMRICIDGQILVFRRGLCTYSYRSVDLPVSWATTPDRALHAYSIAASSVETFPRAIQVASSKDIILG